MKEEDWEWVCGECGESVSLDMIECPNCGSTTFVRKWLYDLNEMSEKKRRELGMKMNLRKMFWKEAEKIYNEEYVGKMRFYFGGSINHVLEKMEKELRKEVKK